MARDTTPAYGQASATIVTVPASANGHATFRMLPGRIRGKIHAKAHTHPNALARRHDAS
jgi:hypothetical protein